ncbi:sarcosine oxidase subunit gamma [Marinivivus vitaminiproducens]|uniref:sarcosine oxidase subunit gamma n=1 Tax=Marinivivus vitaminiproducens TaxID=3035935 RepID=UPI00279B5980|nr:sarcosine oxidase subunit gamma family protein [Geminicoccaceae bacterium SCSIO 64248]
MPELITPLPTERVGALAHRIASVETLPSDGEDLLLAELVPPGMIALRGVAGDERFVRSAGSVLDCVLPLGANTVTSAQAVTVLWLGPDEWLIVTAPGAETAMIARLRTALDGVFSAVVDVTGNRARLRLSGARARDVLAKGMSLDLHPRAFKPGRCAQSTLARAGVLLHQLDEAPTYDLYPRRSFATYVHAWLLDAMTEYGGRAYPAPAA